MLQTWRRHRRSSLAIHAGVEVNLRTLSFVAYSWDVETDLNPYIDVHLACELEYLLDTATT